MYGRLFNRMEPWREVADLQREMNRLFDGARFAPRRAFPAVNLKMNSDEAVVTAELPGVVQKDLQLSVMNDVLTIEGVRQTEETKDGDCCHRRERGTGEFKRSLELPFAVNADKISANLKNGVLTIRLPRREEDKPKSIQIGE